MKGDWPLFKFRIATALSVTALLSTSLIAAPASAFTLLANGGASFTPEYEGADRMAGAVSLGLSGGSSIAHDRTVPLEQRLAASTGKRFQFAPSVNVIGARDADSVSNPQVKLLPEVKTSLELGARIGTGTSLRALGWDDPSSVSANIAARYDVLGGNGGNGGFVIEPSLTAVRPFSETVWGRLSLGGSWASESYMDSYFDVGTAAAAASGLPVFDASAGIKDIRAQNEMRLEFGERWSLGVANEYRYLLGDAADSPVTDQVGSRHQFTTGVKLYVKLWDFDLSRFSR